MGKNLNFKNSDSLDMVRTLLDEAELSLDDETRKLMMCRDNLAIL
mgnify:CR=1 FL=1